MYRGAMSSHARAGQVAIVTGAASGIGKVLSERLAEEGAIVVLADIRGDEAHAAAEAIQGGGGKAEGAILDVSDAVAVERLVDSVVTRHRRLDYMFNNAGFGIVGELRDVSAADFRRIVDVNLLGVVYGSGAAYSAIRRQGDGHIVNTASFAGLVGFQT